MADFAIHGRRFRSGKFDLFTQLKIEKRIGVVYPAVAAARAVFETDPVIAAGYVTSALSRLSDDDLAFVVGESLALVQVEQAANLWVDIKTKGASAMQFADITLSDVHLMVFYVLHENFAPFIAALPSLVSSMSEMLGAKE